VIEVSVGDAVPPRVVEDVDAEKMKTMAALLHDPNPIHWDVEAVARLGLGDRPVNQGPSNMGYIVNALVDFTGDARTVRNVDCRFNGNVFAGDRVVASGEVTAVRDTDDGRVVECDVWLERDGDRVVTGTARLVWDHHVT
jgi:acyl dehydratase